MDDDLETGDEEIQKIFGERLCFGFLEPVLEALGDSTRDQQSRKTGISVKTLEHWFRKTDSGWQADSSVTGANLLGITTLAAAFNARYDCVQGVNLVLSAYEHAFRAIDSEPEFDDLDILAALLLVRYGREFDEPDPRCWTPDDQYQFVDQFIGHCENIGLNDGKFREAKSGYFAAVCEYGTSYMHLAIEVTDATGNIVFL
jgi:hypothetical protein